MPYFPKPEARRVPFIHGTEEARVFKIPDENLIERRFKKEKDGQGGQTGFCEPLKRFWTHKFAHSLFPDYSIDVVGLRLAGNFRERSRLYSKFIPHDSSNKKELEEIYKKIERVHTREDKFKKQIETDEVSIPFRNVIVSAK